MMSSVLPTFCLTRLELLIRFAFLVYGLDLQFTWPGSTTQSVWIVKKNNKNLEVTIFFFVKKSGRIHFFYFILLEIFMSWDQAKSLSHWPEIQAKTIPKSESLSYWAMIRAKLWSESLSQNLSDRAKIWAKPSRVEIWFFFCYQTQVCMNYYTLSLRGMLWNESYIA